MNHTQNMANHMVKVTYTIDETTASSVRELSLKWDIPQSEVVRRAVQMAKHESLLQPLAMTPLEVLKHLDQEPTLSSEEYEKRIKAARQIRESWRPPENQSEQ
jgi:hypothetical protein